MDGDLIIIISVIVAVTLIRLFVMSMNASKSFFGRISNRLKNSIPVFALKKRRKTDESVFGHAKAKSTDEKYFRLLLPSLASIALCMICLAGTTWAWFTASISAPTQTIVSANYDILVELKDGDAAVLPIENKYSLSANTAYTVTLTANGTAKQFGGYCIVKNREKTLYTAAILPDSTIVFTLVPETAAEYTFTAVLGTYSGTADITDGCTVGKITVNEPSDTEPPTEKTNENIYVVKSGDTLSSIASNYGVSAEKIAAYNGITSDTVLQVGQKIKIPPADYILPEESTSSPAVSEPQTESNTEIPTEAETTPEA